MDAGQHVPGMFIWRFIKAWKVQEFHLRNQFKDDPPLAGRLFRRILVKDGEPFFKAQLAQIDKHKEFIISLQEWFQPQMRKITQWLSQLTVKGTEFEVHLLQSETLF